MCSAGLGERVCVWHRRVEAAEPKRFWKIKYDLPAGRKEKTAVVEESQLQLLPPFPREGVSLACLRSFRAEFCDLLLGGTTTQAQPVTGDPCHTSHLPFAIHPFVHPHPCPRYQASPTYACTHALLSPHQAINPLRSVSTSLCR